VEEKKSYIQNWISLAGILFSLIFFLVICFMIGLDLFLKDLNPYLQSITYIFVPGLLIASLALIPVGILIERKRRVRPGGEGKFPVIDFNHPAHQRWILTTAGVVTIFGLFSLFGAYRAYEFTDSVAFCGLMCHKVMEPEHTAYQHSSHARVACVRCHIGPGAEWFVRAKLSGLYQIYSTLTNRYHRPIETPVKNLRPAEDTCEQCHWPQHFYGAVQQDHTYFLTDEANTSWKADMLMQVGGGFPQKEGIHWHMNIKNKIEYAATDKKRLEIPWVRRTDPEGNVEVYKSEEAGAVADAPPGEIRRMDCVDCHNRPSHIYRSPDRAVNQAMAAGTIPPSLPFVKREAVRVLAEPYASVEEAASKIRTSLEGFYREQYPDIFRDRHADVVRTVQAVTDIYQTNFFPAMKVSWKEYPDHIGHMIFPGCFRCHDGKHKSASGKVITQDCSKCHLLIEQGEPGAPEKSVDGLPFRHPGEDDGAWKEMPCYDCHTGS